MSTENDDLASAIFIDGGERDPIRLARGGRPMLPKRFYSQAEAVPVTEGFAVLLDGKPVRTPARSALVLPTLALAQAIAAEWNAQGELLDPNAMPLTRLANSAIDGVAPRMAEVEADAVRYAGSDLICYRADAPDSLVRAQSEAWDPLVQFAREKCGARLILCEGVTFHPQSPEALAAIATCARAHVGAGAGSPFRLAALHATTTLTGSCIIALAVALREIDVEAGFMAAYVDEDHQMRVWGADAEAMARRERRGDEMGAAAKLSALAG
jgi:chaperone required for assembly of F1-ATPase